ncbi:hypothetical protein [Roseomonas sp. BN140053]|uniref:hypothetical protein n=1 Tax=Roseomonas sp. BN140053 TaxID=3391898 RepID=UPI0039EA7060
MRKWLVMLGLLMPLAGTQAQQPGQVPPGGPPHAFLMGSWTGGIFSAADNEGAACFAQPTVIFTRDVIMRVSSLDVAYRQRFIETAAPAPNGGVEFRLAPPQASVPSVGGRMPPDVGFGCADPSLLRVERRGENEIAFPDCAEFPAPLRRCVTPR